MKPKLLILGTALLLLSVFTLVPAMLTHHADVSAPTRAFARPLYLEMLGIHDRLVSNHASPTGNDRLGAITGILEDWQNTHPHAGESDGNAISSLLNYASLLSARLDNESAIGNDDPDFAILRARLDAQLRQPSGFAPAEPFYTAAPYALTLLIVLSIAIILYSTAGSLASAPWTQHPLLNKGVPVHGTVLSVQPPDGNISVFQVRVRLDTGATVIVDHEIGPTSLPQPGDNVRLLVDPHNHAEAMIA